MKKGKYSRTEKKAHQILKKPLWINLNSFSGWLIMGLAFWTLSRNIKTLWEILFTYPAGHFGLGLIFWFALVLYPGTLIIALSLLWKHKKLFKRGSK